MDDTATAPNPAPPAGSAAPTTSSRSIFAIPSPIRSLFNHFPLHTYPQDALPSSSAATTKAATTTTSSDSTKILAEPITTPRLYIFTSPDHDPSAPSPNPTCLKHQTYLRAARVPHDCLPSTNHASPSGALPFLLLPPLSQTASVSSPPSLSNVPLTGGRIVSYARKHAGAGEKSAKLSDAEGDELEVKNPKMEAYRALINQAIRPAWLHDLYLLQSNAPLLTYLYLPRPSTIPHVPLLHTLRSAATTEILQTTRRPSLDIQLLHDDALVALASLDAILAAGGDGPWFFGAEEPSLFDAEVFAYTWPLLDEDGAMAKLQSGLRDGLKGMENLVRHRARLYERCWGHD
ncbi:outer mitochondrial membrane transport complex protein [Sarocladium implicatum]|nr:outer mitochondrial membrane transport complex protein [Sarocladium implicatum]